MMIRSLKCAVLVISLFLLPFPAAADVIVPGSLAAIEGNQGNCYPFSCGGSMRYQQVYGAQEFGLTPMWIDAVLFRPDVLGVAFTASTTSLQIDLSTTSAGPDALSTVFANNLGANNMTVRTGSLSYSSARTAGSGNTRAFDIVMPFAQSFFYDPTLGNLLLDVRIASAPITPSSYLDSESSIGDSISRLWATNGPTATTGTADSVGLVTKFQTGSVNTVPDTASSLSLLVLSLSGLGAARQAGRHR